MVPEFLKELTNLAEKASRNAQNDPRFLRIVPQLATIAGMLDYNVAQKITAMTPYGNERAAFGTTPPQITAKFVDPFKENPSSDATGKKVAPPVDKEPEKQEGTNYELAAFSLNELRKLAKQLNVPIERGDTKVDLINRLSKALSE